MKMDLVSLMGERLEFSKKIADEVQPSIREWGVKLVDLECIHFQDTEGYTVIKDLEQRRSTKINSTTRQQVAEQNKLADIAESNAQRETEKTVAENEEAFKTRQIERDETLGTRTQDKEQAIAKAEQEANKQKVESMRTLEVGKADVEKQSTIRRAEGKAGETKTVGEADAEVVRLTGTAEADVTKRKAFAEAEGIDKKAEAQKKYQESGAFAIEVIGKAFDTYRDIEIAKFVNLAKPLEKADIKVLSTGEERELFGIPISAKSGIAMGGMLEGIKEISGFDVGQAIEDAASGVKDFLGKGKKKEEAKKK